MEERRIVSDAMSSGGDFTPEGWESAIVSTIMDGAETERTRP